MDDCEISVTAVVRKVTINRLMHAARTKMDESTRSCLLDRKVVGAGTTVTQSRE
jgi:hypothetical protein